MSRVAKVWFVAAASLAIGIGTAVADDDPQPAGDGSDATQGGGDGAGSGSADANGGGEAAASASAAYTKDTWPTELVDRPNVLAKGMIQIHADLFANMSTDNSFKPFSIAPDIFYGVSDKLSVGVTHAIGICPAGTDNGCAKVYNDIGVDTLFSLKKDEKMDLASHVGVDVGAFSPDLVLAAHLGVLLKYQIDKLGIFVDPAIGIGLTQRDAGNKETLAIPVQVAYQVNKNLAPFLRTGLGGVPIGAMAVKTSAGANLDVDGAGFGDTYAVPLGIGVLYGLSAKLDVGAELDFPALFGSTLASDIGTDGRFLFVTVNARL
jgi:hypothetical protein